MNNWTCECGITAPVKTFPVRCSCGKITREQPPLPLWVEERYEICKACPQYDKDYCTVLKNQGKDGWILHPRGIMNEFSSCPLRNWEGVRPKKDNLIIAVASGEDYKKEAQITVPLMKDYANRVDAELIVLDGNDYPEYPMLNKWRIHPYIKRWKRTLYLDLDVIISPNAPNIFDSPASQVALYDEYDDVLHNELNWIDRLSREISTIQGYPRKDRTWMANGGVLLFPQWAADMYSLPRRKQHLWCLDQILLTIRLDHFGITPHFLDPRWNWGYTRADFWDGLEKAHFIHLNGCRPNEYRLRLLERCANRNFDPIPPQPGNHWRPKWVLSSYSLTADVEGLYYDGPS